LLEEVLVPVYFHHRYQLDAAVKPVGGLLYDYAVRGDPAPEAEPVPAAAQRRALEAVLATVEPELLDLPEPVLRLLLPRAPGYPPHRELVRSRTGPAFDALGAAATAAEMAVAGLLQPERAARLVDQHRRDPELPSLEEILDRVVAAAFAGPAPGSPRLAEIERTVQAVVVRGLLDLAGSSAGAGEGEGAGASAGATPAVAARTEAALEKLAGRLEASSGEGADAAHRAYLGREIRRFLERRHEDRSPLPAPAEPPPGSPIGTDWMGRGCGYTTWGG
ncbi:MAG TPA: zinc-dependent metalloprotease, partial [Thermoanaerobaculia bacterium]|nr:zinc-dependent metalloprotease [Thermoanaerobaculia bacterium]